MSKTTLVSVLPFGLREEKPGQIPTVYVIPPAPKNDISTIIVEEAFYLELVPYSDTKMPPRRVPILSETVANGIIQDYIGANLAVSYDPLENGATPAPGLFYVEGGLDKDVIKTFHKDKINRALLNTKAWFQRLVEIADDDWQKHHLHKMVTDLQRAACNFLELKREWNFNVFDIQNQAILCPMCKVNVHPEAIICNSCKCILNEKVYNENKNKFATTGV